jgi:hypothetical protein
MSIRVLTTLRPYMPFEPKYPQPFPGLQRLLEIKDTHRPYM